jgi:hypothetical protein
MQIDGHITKLFQFQGREWLEIEVEHMMGSLSVPNENKDWRCPEKVYVVGDKVHVAITPDWTAYTADEREMRNKTNESV